MLPAKLQPGNQVRILSPAISLSAISQTVISNAVARLTALGLKVTFAQHAKEVDELSSSSVKSRLNDLHTAFANPEVKAIITTLGGYNSNQLLNGLDYQLIAQNPKILVGYSDITALAAAIYAKTGLVTYSGPHFSTFGMEKGFTYIHNYFLQCLFSSEPYSITPSAHWSNDEWYIDQQNRTFYPNEGYWILQSGNAQGICIGGNLCTLNLLQGTPFMPNLTNAILFLEDDSLSNPNIFDRDLQSLLHLPQAQSIKGLVVGRFEKASGMRLPLLKHIINTKPQLKNIPIIANADFGHTTPFFTFPIGGQVSISATQQGEVSIGFSQHVG
ncbi:MAG TPA: LD-carboxypeptidase [Chitinophagales bacterium]|nr:LD-carboxypeptidase [Chitinophagales bacterium]HRK26417.1 LD-carboxypeptidase [Chitinophagales bacterium]